MLKRLRGRLFAKGPRSGQSIVLAVITITFMAGIGYALVMWSRAQSRQAVQKEQHGSAEEMGKAAIDQAIYEMTTPSGQFANYTWGDGFAGLSEAWLQVTQTDGTTVGVHLEERGDSAVQP